MLKAKWKILALGVAASGLAVVTPAQTQASRPFYVYNGKPVMLDRVTEELIVGYVAGVDASQRRSLALSSGALEVNLEHLADSAWRVRLDEPAARPAQQKDLSAARPRTTAAAKSAAAAARAARDQEAFQALRDDPSVEFVYQALRNAETGNLLFPTSRIIVKVRNATTEAALGASLPGNVTVVERLYGTTDQYILRLVDPKVDDPLAVSVALANDSSFEWAEPDFIQDWRKLDTPNDTLFNSQWHHLNTGQGSPAGLAGADTRITQGWDFATGNGTAVIAIIDDGVQLTHPDLSGRIFVNAGEIPGNAFDDDGNGRVDDVNGWDFFQNDNDPNPILTSASHGTAVAGVAASQGNNALGGTGSCRNCRILPVRVAGATFTTDANLAAAINYAGTFADVLNNSWGGGGSSAAIDAAILNVTTTGRAGKGAPVLFATGNSASAYVTVPVPVTVPAGTHTFEWSFEKDDTVDAGFDSAWLDNVVYPDGTVDNFEGCASLPGGWTTSGNANWTAVNGEARASSTRGGNCAIKAGEVGPLQVSTVQVTKTFAVSGQMRFETWVSAERNSPGGVGPIVGDNGTGTPECFDGIFFSILPPSPIAGTYYFICGTYSNQGNPLADGTIAYPASNPNAISIGGATNFDRRSDYAQWGTTLDIVAHTSGGSLGITTTDIVGANGYSATDYTSTFGGTSSATPNAAGITGVLLTDRPNLRAADVRTELRAATRKIGPVAYVNGRNDNYGYGVLNAHDLLDRIWYDSLETGNTNRWTTVQTDGGDLSVAGGPPAMSGSFGMSLLADDTNSLSVEDGTPTNEARYRGRFLINPNNFDPGEAQGHLRTRIFIGFDNTPQSRAFAIVLRRQLGVYAISARVRRDDGTRATTPFVNVAAGTNTVEFDFRRSSAPGANNGTFSLIVNGGAPQNLSGIDNDLTGIDAGRWGLLSVKTGAAGTVYLDDFRSRRTLALTP